MNNYINYIIITLIFFFNLLSCATDKLSNNSNGTIKIDKIKANKVENRAPKESDFQVEIELSGIVNDDTLKQDIKYDWSIQYIKSDISDNYISNISKDNLTSDNYLGKKYEKGYYFLDISNDPLNALLTAFQPGYYKIILQATNSNETKEQSIILKIGDPNIPELFVKINIPKLKNPEQSDFKGKFYLKLNNDLENIQEEKIVELNAKDLMDNWYNTGYSINPFNSFTIQAGTYLLNTEPVSIFSFNQGSLENNNDKIIYSLNGGSQEIINTTPIVFKKINNSINTVTISKIGIKEWKEGEIFLSFLSWINDKDEFKYFEKKLTSINKSLTIDLNNSYQTKIFVGSLGHLVSNRYFIYFGPEGTEAEELDPKGLREYPGVPYGFLLGKLGPEGKVFQIGNNYSHTYDEKIEVYSLDDSNTFQIEN